MNKINDEFVPIRIPYSGRITPEITPPTSRSTTPTLFIHENSMRDSAVFRELMNPIGVSESFRMDIAKHLREMDFQIHTRELSFIDKLWVFFFFNNDEKNYRKHLLKNEQRKEAKRTKFMRMKTAEN